MPASKYVLINKNKKDNDKRLMTSSNDKMIFQVLETKRTHFVFFPNPELKGSSETKVVVYSIPF